MSSRPNVHGRSRNVAPALRGGAPASNVAPALRGGAPASNVAPALRGGAPASSVALEPIASRDHGGALDFERIYVEHVHHVARWARALGGLDADVDDLTQDVFMVVRRKLGDFDGRSLPAWLYGITRKTVSDYRRRAWLRRLLGGVTRSLDASPQLAPAAREGTLEQLEAKRIVGQVLARMSRVRRSAFMLFEIEGYSGEEIAELEQIPLATVYTRLHHARKDFLRLTAELTGQPSEEPPP